jgi:membrane protease YdiL (CAAX protease family)
MHTLIQPARRGTLLLFVIAHALATAIVNLLLFSNGVFHPLAFATGGVLTGTLVVGLVLIAVLIGGVCLRFGRLRAYDIGWIPAHLPAGLALTALVWVLAQLIHLAAGGLHNGAPAWSPLLAQQGVLAMLGVLIGQLLGNALFEELAYRGFLFPQLYLRIHGDGEQPWRRFLITLLLSQAIFALIHIPNRLYMGMTPAEIAADLPLLLCWGVLFTLVYLRTDNLFIVTGIHALGNAPTTLFATAPALSGDRASLLIYALATLVIFVLPWLARLAESFLSGGAAGRGVSAATRPYEGQF